MSDISKEARDAIWAVLAGGGYADLRVEIPKRVRELVMSNPDRVHVRMVVDGVEVPADVECVAHVEAGFGMSRTELWRKLGKVSEPEAPRIQDPIRRPTDFWSYVGTPSMWLAAEKSKIERASGRVTKFSLCGIDHDEAGSISEFEGVPVERVGGWHSFITYEMEPRL